MKHKIYIFISVILLVSNVKSQHLFISPTVSYLYGDAKEFTVNLRDPYVIKSYSSLSYGIQVDYSNKTFPVEFGFLFEVIPKFIVQKTKGDNPIFLIFRKDMQSTIYELSGKYRLETYYFEIKTGLTLAYINTDFFSYIARAYQDFTKFDEKSVKKFIKGILIELKYPISDRFSVGIGSRYRIGLPDYKSSRGSDINSTEYFGEISINEFQPYLSIGYKLF